MEIKVIELTKNKLIIEIPGADHTLCNAIKEELHNHKDVKFATYKIDHPLTSKPIMHIEADNPVKVLEASIKKLEKQVSDLGSAFKAIRK